MLFLESVPDTSRFFIAGYTVAFVTLGLYLLSLWWRFRSLQKDIETLQELDKE